jgi:hypothetical protein
MSNRKKPPETAIYQILSPVRLSHSRIGLCRKALVVNFTK